MEQQIEKQDSSAGRRGFVRKLQILLAAFLIASLIVFAQPRIYAAPDFVEVTVTIIRFIEVQNPDSAWGQGCCGDYYAKVWIAGVLQPQTDVFDDKADISPWWRFTAAVDRSLFSAIFIVIEIWDADTWAAGPDDIMDLNPVDGVQELNLLLDLNLGTWSGDVPANVGFSLGDGDHEHFGATAGGESGKILFDISLGSNGDVDGDGIPGGVERFGVRDTDGNLVADMAAMGADPCRKTIALEIDFMTGAADGHTHQPKAAAITDVISAFNAAPVPAVPPVPCPYAGFPARPSGVNLVVDVSNAIPEQAVFALGPEFTNARDANFNAARRPYFHYAIFVHDQAAGSSSSGLCCSGNKDFIVSLGSWRLGLGDVDGDGTLDSQVGTFRDQSGSIMHELGHSLGLGHGGADGTNYKPNYLSVMNYLYDPGGIPHPIIPGNRLDYSRAVLPTLTETMLFEAAGIGDKNYITGWTDLSGTRRGGLGNVPLDWTGNDFDANGNPTDDSAVTVDLDNDGRCVGPGNNGILDTTLLGADDFVGWDWMLGTNVIRDGPDRTCNTAAAAGTDDEQIGPTGNLQVADLVGFDDWSNLKYRAVLSPDAGGAAFMHGPDITFQEAQANQQFFAALLSPDLEVNCVGQADAVPGDTLTYTVTVTNIGTGPANTIQLTDTLPDGSNHILSLPDLEAGDSTTRIFTFAVPFPLADLTVLTNKATITGKDLFGLPDDDPSNNVASASTVVHTPVLNFGKTATPLVNPGEIVTYVITYQNTGSGTAESVVIKDTLSSSVYYSLALDVGTGPPPNAVTNNPDGTTTLTWTVGTLPSGIGTIQYTARPSLLMLPGSSFSNNGLLDFSDANGNDHPSLTASASTKIRAVTPTRDPKTLGFWRNHANQWTPEILARIQATDQRFDGADGTAPDGKLSSAEIQSALAPGGNMAKVLKMHLLATLFNLATHRITCATIIQWHTPSRLVLRSVREAVLYVIATLDLPVHANRDRYSDATCLLHEINSNWREVY